MLGHPCDRWLWLSFRWAVIEKFEGRILRLFRRGQLEEHTIIKDLVSIGLQVRELDQQERVSFGWHVGGSIDAIIDRGVPESPERPHIAEFKTHSKKSFDELIAKGVESAKKQHFVQMQLYMLGTGIDRALYLAVCKDDDRIYTERVKFDEEVANRYLQRGYRIVQSERMPQGISSNPSWYECKMCAAHEFCFSTRLTKEVNCRTCCHSTPRVDDWLCELHGDAIPPEFMLEGCDSHCLHPDLVPWELNEDASTEHAPAYMIDGVPVLNGVGGVSSRELIGRFAQ